jgi:hypothetical protein
VLIVQTFGTPHPARRPRRRRKAKPVEPPAEPETVPVTRITVAEAAPFETPGAAAAWLERTLNDRNALNEAAREGVELLNTALGALRDAANDPLIGDVGVTNALVVRLGFGSGEELAHGHWTEARELPSPGPRRHEQLDPQRQVANRLAGRGDDDQGEDD